MRRIKEAIKKIRGARQSILRRDGTTLYLPDPEDRKVSAQGKVYSHFMECAECDYNRTPRPPATEWHWAMCDAVDRVAAIRMFHADFVPTDNEDLHRGDPYCLDCIVRRGILVDIAIHYGTETIDLRPIPHGEPETIPWDPHHAPYREVA